MVKTVYEKSNKMTEEEKEEKGEKKQVSKSLGVGQSEKFTEERISSTS